AQDFGGLSLTAGDWEVLAQATYVAANTTAASQFVVEINSATNFGGTSYAVNRVPGASSTSGYNYDQATPRVRISLSGTTTIFCSQRAIFTVSTMTGGGACTARRVR